MVWNSKTRVRISDFFDVQFVQGQKPEIPKTHYPIYISKAFKDFVES